MRQVLYWVFGPGGAGFGVVLFLMVIWIKYLSISLIEVFGDSKHNSRIKTVGNILAPVFAFGYTAIWAYHFFTTGSYTLL